MKPSTLALRSRAAAWFLAVLACAAPMRAADRKPNFLFVYTDDQRWDAMGVVQREQGERARFPWFKSPNMDRLAAEGVRFRNAFVTLSLCAPSRAAFLTGRYNHLNGIINNHTEFPADSVTHATLLRAAGYRTAYIGKWHMGNQRGQRPGFDYSASFIAHGRYNDCPVEINGVSTPTKGWIDDVSTDFAIEWMKQNRDRPFSLVLGFKSPHSPRGGTNLPERLRNLYAGETSRPAPNSDARAIFHGPPPERGNRPHPLAANSVHLDYLRHVTGADENLGRLLDTLDELGVAEDTVVVYASDNGYYLGEHGLGDKRSIYEESLRIPMLVRYPRLFSKGKVVDEMVLNIDLAPTFLDLAGVPVPAEMQGASWKALAAGQKPANWRQSFLAEYFYENGGGDTPTLVGVRTATAKLVKYPGHDEWTELFDLAVDPYELKNLAGDPAVMAKLNAEFDAQTKAMNYFVPANADTPRAPAAKATYPNSLVILADDLGYGDVHCYNPERGKIQTPNLDRLASQGMRFTCFGTDVPNWPPYCFIENDRTLGLPDEFLPAAKFARNLASQQGPASKDWKLENIEKK
jgi:arylsulfatase A-like enzyme